MQILIRPDGWARCVYSELVDLSALGKLTITRGSYVEPTTDGRWTANLSPVAGPSLGPFEHRSLAIRAEQAWLESHWLSQPE